MYAGPVSESYKIQVRFESILPGAKEFSTSYSNDFVAVIGPSNDIYVSTMDQQEFTVPTGEIKAVENPLNNAGCYCAGGFCNR